MRDGEWEKLPVENRLAGITRLRFWLYLFWGIFTGITGWMLVTNRINWYTLLPMIPFCILTVLISGCNGFMIELQSEILADEIEKLRLKI